MQDTPSTIAEYNNLDVRGDASISQPQSNINTQTETVPAMEENTASLVARPLELQNESISNTANSTPTLELGPTPMVDEVLEMELPTSIEPVMEDRPLLETRQNDNALYLEGVTQYLETITDTTQAEQTLSYVGGDGTPVVSPDDSISSLPDDISLSNSPSRSDLALESLGERTPIQGSPIGTPVSSPRALENPLPLSFENLERYGLSTLQLSASFLSQMLDNGTVTSEEVMSRDETDDDMLLDNGDVNSEDSYDLVSSSTVRSVSSSSSSDSNDSWEQISQSSHTF